MSDRENGRRPGAAERVAAVPKDLRESLDELAENVDSLVDRLTTNMGDDPVAELARTPVDTPPVTAEPPARTDKPPVAAEPPATPPAPVQMEDEDDAETDRLLDGLMAESAESTPAQEIVEPVVAEAPAHETTATVDELLPEADAVATAESVGAEGEPAGEQPSADDADEARGKESVVPWSELESPPETGRFGGLWKLATAACVLGIVATAAWFMLWPDRTTTTTSSRSVDLSAPAREAGSAADRVAQLAFPARANTRDDDTNSGDPSPAAAIPGESTDTTTSDGFTSAEIEDAPAPAEPVTPGPSAVVTIEPTVPIAPVAPATKAVESGRVVEPTAPATVADRRPAATSPAPSEARPEPARTAASRPERSTAKPTPPPAPALETPARTAASQPIRSTAEPTPPPAPALETPARTAPDTIERPTEAPDSVQPTRVASNVEPTRPASSPQPKATLPLTTPTRTDSQADPAGKTVAPTGAGAEIVPPKLLSRAEPVYPTGARGKSAIVELSVLVNERGRVVRVVVESGPPGSDFEARAIDAALRSTYKPAMQDGQAVRAWTTERFVFER